MTWLVHMRDPVALWRDLGPRGFAGMQVLLLGSVLQPMLAPALWTLWFLSLGLPHTVALALTATQLHHILLALLLTEAITALIALIAIHRAGALRLGDRALRLFPAGHPRFGQSRRRGGNPAVSLGQDPARRL